MPMLIYFWGRNDFSNNCCRPEEPTTGSRELTAVPPTSVFATTLKIMLLFPRNNKNDKTARTPYSTKKRERVAKASLVMFS